MKIKMITKNMRNIYKKRKFQKMFAKEKKEHPTFTDKQIKRIVKDHFKWKPRG